MELSELNEKLIETFDKELRKLNVEDNFISPRIETEEEYTAPEFELSTTTASRHAGAFALSDPKPSKKDKIIETLQHLSRILVDFDTVFKLQDSEYRRLYCKQLIRSTLSAHSIELNKLKVGSTLLTVRRPDSTGKALKALDDASYYELRVYSDYGYVEE